MSMRLLIAALCAAALAGCASYPSDAYHQRVVHDDGRYYAYDPDARAPDGDAYGQGYDDGYDDGYGRATSDYRYALGPIGYVGYSGFCSVRYRSCAPYWFGAYSYWPSYSHFGFSLSYGSGGWFAPWAYSAPYYSHGHGYGYGYGYGGGYYGAYGYGGGYGGGYRGGYGGGYGNGNGYRGAPVHRGNRPGTWTRPPVTPPAAVVETPMPKPTSRPISSRPLPRPLRPEPVTGTPATGPSSEGEPAWGSPRASRARYREPVVNDVRYRQYPDPATRYPEPSPPVGRYRSPTPAPGVGVRPAPKPAYQEWRPTASPERAPMPRRDVREPERDAPAWREERNEPQPSSDGNDVAPRARRRPERAGGAEG